METGSEPIDSATFLAELNGGRLGDEVNSSALLAHDAHTDRHRSLDAGRRRTPPARVVRWG